MSTSETPPFVPRPYRRWMLGLAALWPAVVVLIGSLLTGAYLQHAYTLRDITIQQELRSRQLEGLRDRLHSESVRAFSPTSGLSTLIQVDGSISSERFQQLIDRSLVLVPFIRSVVAAPDDVARYVYPLKGNERVVNLEYRSIPAQWNQILLAREARAPRIFAPVKLVQGGAGVIQRTPVFLRESGQERYWGVVSVVLDLDRFMAAAAAQQDEGMDLAVFGTDPSGLTQTLIWGQWNNARDDAVVRSVLELPGARWELRTRPTQGWVGRGVAPEALVLWAGGVVLSALVALLIRQSQHLHRGNRALVKEMATVRNMQTALEQSRTESIAARDRLQAVLDAATEVAIIAADLEGRVTVFNRGAQEMLGYRAEEVLGQSPAIWHDGAEIERVGESLRQGDEPPPRGFAVFAHLAMTTEQRPLNWTYITRDGQRLEVSLALSSVRSEDGSPLGYLGVARDLSAQRRAESELRQLTQELEQRVAQRTAELQATLQTLEQAQEGLARSEKLAALGALVAGVAHELNTPIGNCLTTASTLQERTQDIAESARRGEMRKSAFEAYLENAAQASAILLRGLTSAADLVQHFKQLSADQTSELRRRFFLTEVVGDVVSLSRATWKASPHTIQTDIDPTIAMDSYPGALGRVLGNILHNALLHAFEGRDDGVLRITARQTENGSVEITLEDNGIGMRDEVRRRVFDPFFTTKLGRGGSGLGMNIVYNAVTGMLGGQIEVHSQTGSGTRITLCLPPQAPQPSGDAVRSAL